MSGNHAWNQTGETITPNWAVADRAYQLWLTPHGVMKAAMAHNAITQTKTEGGEKLTTIAFMVSGELKANVFINENNLIEKVDALRKQRTGRLSRNTWILEAIEDKVERETQARR